jgi:hypothetical protein
MNRSLKRQRFLRLMNYSSNFVSDALIRLGLAAQAEGLPHVIIGGNAVIHYGVPRFTRDVDFLIPESDASRWEKLLKDIGYFQFHAAGAFAQYETEAKESILAPVDLMMVNEETWKKLYGAAISQRLVNGYEAHWPALLHLIALKLHAWRGVNRQEKERDWSDILELIKQTQLNTYDESFCDILQKYGGLLAVKKLRGV